ncbi:MAG TPA: hypothetical protein VFC78_04055 [Tepidisphaeraceae bacterium]|nr:hypothetical protein [Tepidisphaeraceae bacterium]
MKGRVLILLAVLAYLAAFGCVMWPTAPPAGTLIAGTGSDLELTTPAAPAVKLDEMPYRGIVLQVQRIDDPEPYHKTIDAIAAAGADTIEIVVDSRVENGSSSVIFIDLRMSAAQDKLTELIKYAKGKGLRVVVMPLVLIENPEGNEWRGQIHPRDWSMWFNSYRDMEGYYATSAAQGHADVFVVGSELVSTEQYKDEWVHTISDVRRIFPGLLTYSANWDHYQKIPFWDHLDIISTNCYYKLGDNRDVAVSEIVSRWKAIQADLLPWVRKQGKPYMFTEVGWCSVANAASEPWDYTQETVPIDLELQRKLYEGFFKVWYGVPQLGGFMIWQYAPNAGGPEDRGYTPQGKPAEKVLRYWLGKPRWKVDPK